jgi:hypothetical protein
MGAMRSWEWTVVACLAAAGGGFGCDKEATKAGADASPAAAPSAAPKAETPPPPEPPRAPAITVDDHTCTVDGTVFSESLADWSEQAAALLAKKPLVAGEAVVINAMRDAKAPRVERLVAALAIAKAKSVIIRSPTRDQSTGELHLTFAHAGVPDCSAVAFIEHDGAVAVWNKGGSGAQRFARGMAGPDLTSSTDALRKHAASCDSPLWYLGGADTVTWGLMFDLAMRAKGGAEAGSTLRPTEAVLLTHAPVPGRRLPEE